MFDTEKEKKAFLYAAELTGQRALQNEKENKLYNPEELNSLINTFNNAFKKFMESEIMENHDVIQ